MSQQPPSVTSTYSEGPAVASDAARTTDAQGCETCPTCRRYTIRGHRQRAEQYRERPIYETDFTKPTGEIIEEVRRTLTRARGTLYDIGAADPFWKERLQAVEGLLTCGLVALYNAKQEAEAASARALLPVTPSRTDSDSHPSLVEQSAPQSEVQP